VDHYPHNCVSTAQIYVKPPDTLQAIMRYNPSVVDLPNTQIQFTDVSMGTILRNKWVFDDKVVENTYQTYYTTAPDDDSIRVILIVYDTNTCSDTAEVIIPIRRGEIWIPNAFTPDNHDGNATNEVFKVSGLNIVEFEIHVYSRGGQLVYESTDLDGVWDGTHNGNKCLPGSYVYIVKYRLASHPERLETKTGSILLIR
ncbi:MAG: gliding motility-associated C-terminal domain-containing protein, partial [Bacteroidales bacterium]|nr:gliding motility-associated C-terminal domain-containing protein [Bacteroidales bacterium]